MAHRVITWLLAASGRQTVIEAPVIQSVQSLGYNVDERFAQNFYSDGGAGGYVNGYHLITLSDTRVQDPNLFPEAHTAYAYYGLRDPTDPREITIVGNYTPSPHSLYSDGGAGLIASDPSDFRQDANFAPGPTGYMVQLSHNSSAGLAVWTVYDPLTGFAPLYNTMIEFTVLDPTMLNLERRNVPAQRIALQLFHAARNEPMFGSNGLAHGNGNDDNLYLLDHDETGFKLARVAEADRADRAAYEYYNQSARAWVKNTPLIGDASGNLWDYPNHQSLFTSGLDSSDIFWNEYLGTWLITFEYHQNMFVTYSTTGAIEGPYGAAQTLYGTPLDPACDRFFNTDKLSYAGHAHPSWDLSGKTLLISWESCNAYTNRALVTFE